MEATDEVQGAQSEDDYHLQRADLLINDKEIKIVCGDTTIASFTNTPEARKQMGIDTLLEDRSKYVKIKELMREMSRITVLLNEALAEI